MKSCMKGRLAATPLPCASTTATVALRRREAMAIIVTAGSAFMSVAAEVGACHFALVGTPNSGKTALFNALTGSRQKVANYPGITVERKAAAVADAGRPQRASDRPAGHLFVAGAAAPTRRSPAMSFSAGLQAKRTPDLLLCVADATNLRLALRLVIELKHVGRP